MSRWVRRTLPGRTKPPVGRGRWWLLVLKGVGDVVCSAVVDGPGSGALVRVAWRGSRLEADVVVGGAVGAQHSHGRRQLPSRSFIRSFHFCSMTGSLVQRVQWGR